MQLKEYIYLLGSNNVNNTELMKVFNCDPTWPVCLYDFTYKNKSN